MSDQKTPAPNTILIVDDDEISRTILAEHLKIQGHQTEIAENGKLALDILQEKSLDLILLDLLMPEMDGTETLEKVKQNPHFRNIPVLMLSASGDFDNIVRCIELGADDYLLKPFNPVLLKARVNASLEKKNLRDQEQKFLIASKQQAEESLRVSQEHIHAVVSNAPVILFSMAPDGTIINFEGKIAQEIFTNPQDFIGKKYTDYLEYIPNAEAHIKKITKGEETTFITEIGHNSLEIRLTPSYTAPDGKPYIIGVIVDITERVQREREQDAILHFSSMVRSILDQESLLETILDQMLALLDLESAAIVLVDPKTNKLKLEAARGVWQNCQDELTIPPAMLHMVQPECNDTNPLLLNKYFPTIQIENACYSPLIEHDQTIGVIWIGRKGQTFSKNERGLFAALSEIAANAIHRISLLEDLRRKHAELSIAYDSTIQGWSYALDLRDGDTKDHASRVTDLTVELARELGMNNADLIDIYRGALLHDIGKMAIPDRILLKPGPLNKAEMDLMKKHTIFAEEMISSIEYLQPALDIPRYHHERWDGSGYPHGLSGNDIPLAARIFAVVDVWDALIFDRPYRKAWPEEKAYQYIIDNSGTLFDPLVVEAFSKIRKPSLKSS